MTFRLLSPRLFRSSTLAVLATFYLLFLGVSHLRNPSEDGQPREVVRFLGDKAKSSSTTTDVKTGGNHDKATTPGRRPKTHGARPPDGTEHREVYKPVLAPGECIPQIEYLKRPELMLSEKIVYSRRCIRPVWREEVDRDDIANVTRPLITHKIPVDLKACSHIEFVPCDHMTLEVPYPYPEENYTQFLFGVATTYERLSESKLSFTPWLAGTGAQLIAIVTDSTPGSAAERNLTGLQAEFRAVNVSATLMRPARHEHGTSQLHFAMLSDLVERVTPSTQWIGLLDDDTFFPSLAPLAKELTRHDHTRPAYLGALSEDFQAVRTFGYMAYGGAGVFLSVPLARQLAPHVDSCIASASLDEGDVILRDCVYQHSRAKLTQVPGLFQQDTHMDASGFFESGPRVISLHHWKSWYRAPVVAMAMVAGMCGDCFLQRWRFGNDTVLTNGFSISVYRDGLEAVDLARVEGTWDSADQEYDFSIGPVRRKMDRDEKKSYRLVDAEVPGGGAFRQLYVYKGDAEKEEPDEVVELLWEG